MARKVEWDDSSKGLNALPYLSTFLLDLSFNERLLISEATKRSFTPSIDSFLLSPEISV